MEGPAAPSSDRADGRAPWRAPGGGRRGSTTSSEAATPASGPAATLPRAGPRLAPRAATRVTFERRPGLASLQKALQHAGARSVITSLWRVPDEATKELMLYFYRRIWVAKEPKAQALWNAKKRLREAQDERGQPRYTTRDWAAWVLTGDPR